MALISQQEAVRYSKSSGRNGLIDRYFYFLMSLLIAAITVYGFSRTVDKNLLHPAVSRPFLLWIHGAVFSAWVAFFVLQSVLVRTRNLHVHRTLGWFGAALGTAMVPLGIAVAIIMPRFHIHRLHESPASFEAALISPFYDMAAFGILLGCAVLWRRRRELHRRLILIATCGLTTAAFARFPIPAIQNDYNYVCVDALILVGLLRDLIVDHRVNKVYIYAIPVLAAAQAIIMYIDLNLPPWWLRIAHAMLS